MAVTQRPLCNDCETPEANILTLFTRNAYCGQACLAEGHSKYVRFMLRVAAEAEHVG
jgi:hypothetical protein